MKYQTVIGRFEHIDIVGKIEGVPAKIDTGAYNSAIHATDINIVEKNNKEILKFTLLNHPSFTKKRTLQTTRYRKTEIVSSNGHRSQRYEIKLKVRLGFKVFITTFTLTDRSETVFPILIGRKALNGRFLINPSKAGVNRKELVLARSKINLNEEILEGLNV